jgi:hypothetical protein
MRQLLERRLEPMRQLLERRPRVLVRVRAQQQVRAQQELLLSYRKQPRQRQR